MTDRCDHSGPHDYEAVIATPINDIHLGIVTRHRRLLAVDFVSGKTSIRLPETSFGRHVIAELTAYFADPSHRLTALPCHDSGTEFQRRVWQSLITIPAGKTSSYGELARKLGSAARAIGGACRANPIPIIIPCHRVVSRHGIGGYGGETARGRMLAIKEWLLSHEQVIPA